MSNTGRADWRRRPAATITTSIGKRRAGSGDVHGTGTRTGGRAAAAVATGGAATASTRRGRASGATAPTTTAITAVTTVISECTRQTFCPLQKDKYIGLC